MNVEEWDQQRPDGAVRCQLPTGKTQVGDQAVLGFPALELIENQIAERIKDHAIAIALDRLGDVRVRAHHSARARVDGRMGEAALLGVRLFPILDAGVHGDNDGVGAGEHARYVGSHAGNVRHCYSIVLIGVVAVGLIVGIGEKAIAARIAFDHHALVRLLGRMAGTGGGDAVFGEPIQREADAVAAAIARMIVGGGNYGDSGDAQGFHHLGLGSKYHALLDGTAVIGERRFQIHEGDIRRLQQRREIAERRSRIFEAPSPEADIA